MENEQNFIKRVTHAWGNTICAEEIDLLTRHAIETLEFRGFKGVRSDFLGDAKRFSMTCRRLTATATGISLGLATQGVLTEPSFQALEIFIPTSIFVLICNMGLDYLIKGNLKE